MDIHKSNFYSFSQCVSQGGADSFFRELSEPGSYDFPVFSLLGYVVYSISMTIPFPFPVY